MDDGCCAMYLTDWITTFPLYPPPLVALVESCCTGGTAARLRQTGSGPALLCRMRQVRLSICYSLPSCRLCCAPSIVRSSSPSRYYETDTALRSHWKSKVHKKRCRALKEPAYTIEESERAAGLGTEGKRPSSTTSTRMSATASTTPAVTAAPA